MAKFHITKAGKTEPCRAKVKACPLGEENHFDSLAEASQAAMNAPLPPAARLASRENALYMKTMLVSKPFTARTFVSRQEVAFDEGTEGAGNGVVVSRLRNGNAVVRLPILHERAPGDWVNVSLRVGGGETAADRFRHFLKAVEFEPPSSYRVYGDDEGSEVIAKLSEEQFARLRAAVRRADDVIAEPVPVTPAISNQTLVNTLLAN